MRNQLFAALLAAALCLLASEADAQTASSLFWRKDSLQVKEIASPVAVQYNFVGHHGPAVENKQFALRIYFNDSGSIDVYSKSGRQMELLKYLWYPTEEQQAEEGAGSDEYLVGKTVGLGGIALWDGEKEVKLKATKGRTARVGETKKGHYAEIIAYGVAYKGELVDISIRADVFDGSPFAQITATSLTGAKVQFLTGVNFQKDADIQFGRKWISIWGVHPADISKDPAALGGAMRFSRWRFSKPEKVENMVRIISRQTKQVKTNIIAASVKEDKLNSAEKLAQFVAKGH